MASSRTLIDKVLPTRVALFDCVASLLAVTGFGHVVYRALVVNLLLVPGGFDCLLLEPVPVWRWQRGRSHVND